MSSPNQEGVIKFQLVHQETPPLPAVEIEELDRWRTWMVVHGLIGELQTPGGPLGFGNISRRMKPEFIITGSQTGGIPQLSVDDYCWVTACRLEENLVYSQGPIQPSSEALTHAAVYAQNEKNNWVMHAHHAELWLAAASLGLPITHPEVSYGTPKMAAEVARLFADSDVSERGIFVMGGHTDGIISFGKTAEVAAAVLEKYLGLVNR